MQISWNPNDPNVFATVGKDHIIMCTLTPGAKPTCSKKKATMKGGNFASQSSIAWASDGKTMFTGGADGKIYSWNGVSPGKSFANCKGAVQSLAVGMEGSDEYLLAGGNDKTVTIYKVAGSALTKSNSVTVDAVAKSLDFFKGSVLAGLKNGNIQTAKFEVKMNDAAGTTAETQVQLESHTIMSSHCDGECWGLEVIHLENGEIRVLTSADDNRYWLMTSQREAAWRREQSAWTSPKRRRRQQEASKAVHHLCPANLPNANQDVWPIDPIKLKATKMHKSIWL